MSGRANFRAKWRAEVIRTSLISDSVRVALLLLADHMTDAGYVSVPRSRLAETLNRSPRRVTERLEAAREAGFIDTVRRGAPGRTAEYKAMLPRSSYGADGRTKDMVRIAAPVEVRTGAPRPRGLHGADGGPANTRVTTETRQRNDHQRNDGASPREASDSHSRPTAQRAASAVPHRVTERRSDERAPRDSSPSLSSVRPSHREPPADIVAASGADIYDLLDHDDRSSA